MEKLELPIHINADASELFGYLDKIRITVEMIVTMGDMLNEALKINDLSGIEIDNLQEAISEVSYVCQLINSRRKKEI